MREKSSIDEFIECGTGFATTGISLVICCPCRADKKEQDPPLYSSMELLFTKGPLNRKPAQPFMAEALSIALSLDTPVYDALFIAQARLDHATLVTADRHQRSVQKNAG